MTLRVVGAIAAVAIVLVYAVGSGRYVATNGAWYLSLEAPPWQPPNAVFGLAWTYNFTALAAVGIVLALRLPHLISQLLAFLPRPGELTAHLLQLRA